MPRPRCVPRNLCGLLLVLLLGGCSSAPLPPGIARLPERVELSAVPFFAQTAYQGAPGALAILLLQQGVTTTPGLVAKALHLPEQEAQLQQRIPEVVRGHGLLVYPLSGGLSELLSQVAAGFPVLVRYGQGGSWMGAPRYAVLVGYDRGEQTVLLRAGTSRRWVVDFDDFQAAWQAEGHWALLAQPPAQLPADVDPLRWRAAAADLENAGQALAASNAYRAAAALPAP